MEMLGKYTLLERFGDGIQGSVYKAYDNASHRNVTLFTFGPDVPWDPPLRDHFASECAALLRLRHPSLAVVHEQGEDRKTVFLAAELVPGKTLRQLIAENIAATLERKIAFMVQVAAGLAYAHSQGVLHRRLSPGSVHMLPDGTAKVSGFGCGSLPVSSGAALKAPLAGIYLSPEQLTGKETTAQSDIFSLGLIFYEFVTGVHPFRDADSSKTLDCILHRQQVPTVEQFPNLPFNLWPVLERCLTREVEERYPSMQEFGLACRGMLDELAEDAECMRIELQTALPRLRKATGKRDAPAGLVKLRSDVEQALSGRHGSDYQSLNRLILTLAEQHSQLDSSTEAGSPSLEDPLDLQPSRDLPAPGAEALPDTLSHARPEASASAVPPATTAGGVTPPTCAESGHRTAPAAAAEAPLVSAIGNTPLTRPRTIPKDSFSELLKKIDQGQESTQKLVDSFLAGRQAMAAEKPVPEGSGQSTPSVSSPRESSTVSAPEAIPPAAAARAAAVQRPKPPDPTQMAGANPSPAENTLDAGKYKSFVPPRTAHRRTALWICASTVLLAATFAIPWVRNRIVTGIGEPIVRKGKMLIGVGKPVQTQQDDAMAIAVRNRLNSARRDTMLEEAEILHAVGRRQEALTFLGRLLELYPDFAPSKEELNQINEELSAPSGPEDPATSLQKLLASASAAIRAGNLQKARIDLSAAEEIEPGLPEIARLRKSLDARKTELEKNAARDQETQRTANGQKESETSAARAEELYHQGRYDDALAAAEEHMARYPASTQIRELRSRTVEIRQDLNAYETALGTGKPAEARSAIERIARLNPADPSLAALRKRVESAPASGSASLSIYPLREPATLVLDEQLALTGGELINHAVPAGRHKVVARNGKGEEVEMTYDLADGQAFTLVYDVPGQVLRAMTESDRPNVDRIRARYKTQRFSVEHSHGMLRGSCKGNLVVDYNHVVFQPVSGPHGFSVPYKDLKLRIDNRTAVLLLAGNGTEFFTFKLADIPASETLRRLWDDLSTLEQK